MLDTELSKDSAEALPRAKVIRRHSKEDIKDVVKLCNKKILIVVGENRGINDSTIIKFASSTNTVIYVNHLSNMNNDYTIHGNLLLTCISQTEFDEVFCPDILITIGGQTGDYPLYHRLAGCTKDYEHWRISKKGDVVDTYDHLTKVFECSVEDFFVSINSPRVKNDYIALWNSANKEYPTNFELPLSTAFVAQQMCKIIPEGSIVNFSILNSLRMWNLFTFKNHVSCFCNVGAFGIDGCLSSFIGQSVMVDNMCFMFMGDLSFFYDMNSLGIRHIKNNVRIVVINNNGGVEFKLGTVSSERKTKIDNYIAGANHFKNAEGWARTNGFDYCPVYDKPSFINLKDRLVTESQAPILVEVFSSDTDDNIAYSILKKVKDNRSFKRKMVDRIKKGIKKII